MQGAHQVARFGVAVLSALEISSCARRSRGLPLFSLRENAIAKEPGSS